MTGVPDPPGPSLRANPLPSSWLGFRADGGVLLRVGKVELGQGILTALRQIAAEELDVGVERITLVPAGTDGSPDEGLTAGSRSVMDSGTAVRTVCAEVRACALDAASARTGVPAERLTVVDGEVRDETGRPCGTYADLVDRAALDVPVSGTALPKDPARYRVVGRSLPRVDLPSKLTGAPAFVHDLALPGQLSGRVVRPPAPSARLVSCDERPARELPAVVAVVREGDFLGVVATREEEAVRAAERLRAAARWEEPDGRVGWLPGELVGQEAECTEVARRRDPAAGDRVVAALRATYTRPYVAHASIGPGCAVARWDDDRLEVWCASQGIHPLRRALAAALGLAPGRVVVRHVEGSGCYGHNSADDVACDAALLARAVPGRPVQVVWSREDEFAWEPYGPAMAVAIEAGVDERGDLVTWASDAWGTGHLSRPGFDGRPGLLGARLAAGAPADPAADPSLATGGGNARDAVPEYRVADLAVRAHRVLEMPLRTSALRGLGATVNVFAIESAVDELAVRAGVDPLEYRVRQLADDRARAVLRAVAERSGWAGRQPAESIGWGVGYSRYKDVCGYCAAVARVEAVSELRVTDLWVAVDAGQVVNPDGLVNQLEGGAIQATSWALREQVSFDDRTVTSRDWDGYPVLRFPDVPRVSVTLLDRPWEPPLGAGEVTGGPVTAALANALADAVGVRVRELPLTPERITAAILAS
ncbi:molybdopterin cofactor-binding domain-containing protein [Geodermatophilus sp. SYSU D00965]